MANESKNEKFNAIVEAVCYWLGYQFKIGRDQLIHEASLRYPIADTITAKGVAINKIILEKLHPIFIKKYIDLVIFDNTVKEPTTEVDDSNLKEVYEFKLAKNATSKENKEEHQRVFDDIVRLAYYNMWGDKECYFLMCGKYEDFKAFFVGQKIELKRENGKFIVPIRQKTVLKSKNSIIEKTYEDKRWEPDGIYKEWFGFKIEEEKIIRFERNNKQFGLRQFQNSYKLREPKVHKYYDTLEIKTKCLAITPSGLENVKTHAAGIWKIEAIKYAK